MKKLDEQVIVLEAVDNYAPHTFECEQTVAINAPSIQLHDDLPIRRIERDMTQPDYVRMELTNRSVQYWELDEAYRRMTKDASV